MNLLSHRHSDPIVSKDKREEVKINKDNSKLTVIDSIYKWAADAERTTQRNGKHAGKRPSTADYIGRKAYSNTDVIDTKTKTDIALYPLFKCQSTQTRRPKTSSTSTQYKPNSSLLKSTTGGYMNPATNYSNVLKRRTCSSLTSASWKTQHRNSTSQTKLKYTSRHSFSERYQELCERYRQIPLSGVKNHLSKGVLDLSVDRLKAEDWRPLLEALYIDRELHKICVRSRYPARKVLESRDTQQKVIPATRCPVIFSQYFLMGLTSSLGHCLTNSNSLTALELEGIPLPPRYLSILTKGLVESKKLQYLSFEKCFVGDEGLASICLALRQLPSVFTLNVTMCGITADGIGHLVSLLKFQKMNQYMESWKQSLRYQIPNLDTMSGLRRITLNHNPSIKDEGVAQLCDILDDDLWVRAVDLQRSGVGRTGANHVISLLHSNVSLAIVDLRENKNVPSSLLKQIMQLLSRNNKDQKIE
ncbi:hypothetical protein J437_LFUL009638, partial [Ladona fulva]